MRAKTGWRVLYVILPFACILLAFFGKQLVSDILFSLWPCPFYRFLGIYCPGCGISRSVLRLLQLDVIGSLRFNLCPLLALFFGGLAYAEWGTALFGTHRRLVPRSGWFWSVFGAVMAVYFVVRNLVEFMPN